jgi:hypothetical protein
VVGLAMADSRRNRSRGAVFAGRTRLCQAEPVNLLKLNAFSA